MLKTIVTILALIFITSAYAKGSGSSYSNSLNKQQRLYNQGVEFMLDKEFREAERKFRAALKRDKNWAEAHNNLAYTLRKQGSDNYSTALFHYNKAIALSPSLPEPYMYRGVLHVQMGNEKLAQQDLNTLRKMNSSLVEELEYVIQEGREKSPEQFFGVSSKIDD
jgi:Tfp pilus assembly protein PilF